MVPRMIVISTRKVLQSIVCRVASWPFAVTGKIFNSGLPNGLISDASAVGNSSTAMKSWNAGKMTGIQLRADSQVSAVYIPSIIRTGIAMTSPEVACENSQAPNSHTRPGNTA